LPAPLFTPDVAQLAPTTTVFPKIATDWPNWASVAASEALRIAVCVHVPPLFVKTYT